MLLTLSARCLAARLRDPKPGPRRLTLQDLPRYGREELGLHGLAISTDLLAGANRATLNALRDAADKSGCPCLLLQEVEPQPLGAEDESHVEAAMDRLLRVVQAAHWLGCSAAAISIEGEDTAERLVLTVDACKRLLQRADKLELNLLVAPAKGLTASPERVTELLKKVGGFRMGTLPDFQSAVESGDAAHYLRRLTPYASTVIASTQSFEGPGQEHAPYDLGELVKVITSVGYDGPLAIEHRGGGDVVAGILAARRALQGLLGLEEGAEE